MIAKIIELSVKNKFIVILATLVPGVSEVASIGAMVDGAIVMIENAHKHIEHDGGKKSHWELITDAAAQGARGRHPAAGQLLY